MHIPVKHKIYGLMLFWFCSCYLTHTLVSCLFDYIVDSNQVILSMILVFFSDADGDGYSKRTISCFRYAADAHEDEKQVKT